MKFCWITCFKFRLDSLLHESTKYSQAVTQTEKFFQAWICLLVPLYFVRKTRVKKSHKNIANVDQCECLLFSLANKSQFKSFEVNLTLTTPQSAQWQDEDSIFQSGDGVPVFWSAGRQVQMWVGFISLLLVCVWWIKIWLCLKSVWSIARPSIFNVVRTVCYCAV